MERFEAEWKSDVGKSLAYQAGHEAGYREAEAPIRKALGCAPNGDLPKHVESLIFRLQHEQQAADDAIRAIHEGREMVSDIRALLNVAPEADVVEAVREMVGEREVVRGALQELVALKALKDIMKSAPNDKIQTNGDSRAIERDYEARKPLAWEAARKVLDPPTRPVVTGEIPSIDFGDGDSVAMVRKLRDEWDDGPSPIAASRVVSPPGAAIEVTEITLTEEARRGLTTGLVEIPGAEGRG